MTIVDPGTRYILMPASVLAHFHKEMRKEGLSPEKTRVALMKLGYLIAQESTKGEEKSSDFENFRRELGGRLKTEGLGEVTGIVAEKGGGILISMIRTIEAAANKKIGLARHCDYIAGYLMGLVNAYIPTQRGYICKELRCSQGEDEECTFLLKPVGKPDSLSAQDEELLV